MNVRQYGRAGDELAPPQRPAVLVLLCDSSSQYRVARAFDRGTEIIPVQTVGEARAVLERRQISTLFVEVADAKGVSTISLVEDARSDFPRLAIIGCVPCLRALPDGFVQFVCAGVHQILCLEDLDLGHTVRAHLLLAHFATLIDLVWPTVASRIGEQLAPFVRFGLQHAFEPLRVDCVALALGTHRMTLWHHCHLRELPSPREILSWCRVLAVAFSLDDPGRSIASISSQLTFSSPTALRNKMQRYIHLTPGELRAAGGGVHALHCFVECLGDLPAAGA